MAVLGTHEHFGDGVQGGTVIGSARCPEMKTIEGLLPDTSSLTL